MNTKCKMPLGALLLAFTAFIGCSSDIETVPNSDSKNILNPVSQKADSGVSKTFNSIPDDFPDDVYIADGSKVDDVKESDWMRQLILEYPAGDVDEFVQNHQASMTEKGWEIRVSSKLKIGTTTNYTKDDRKCTVSIGETNGVIKVAIMLPH